MLHCHHQNDSCIKIGSDESHFNVSVGSDGQSHRIVSTNGRSEEKGEPKRYRTEVLPLTSLTLGQTSSQSMSALVTAQKGRFCVQPAAGTHKLNTRSKQTAPLVAFTIQTVTAQKTFACVQRKRNYPAYLNAFKVTDSFLYV